jgi:hypothetical protein
VDKLCAPEEITLPLEEQDMTCTAKIRPFRTRDGGNDTEVQCSLEGLAHPQHSGVLRDYAYPGSETVIEWADGDRRNFYGDWPGDCEASRTCLLPNGHRGAHTQ